MQKCPSWWSDRFNSKPKHLWHALVVACKYGTSYPQIKYFTCVTHAQQRQKHAWHQTMHVHTCKVHHTCIAKQNATRTNASIHSNCQETILLSNQWCCKVYRLRVCIMVCYIMSAEMAEHLWHSCLQVAKMHTDMCNVEIQF